MNSRSGFGFIAWSRVRKQMSCILVGCVILTLSFGNCVPIEAGSFGSRLQSAKNASGTEQVNKKAVDLEIGKPIDREIKPEDMHTYQVRLGPGQFLRAIVNQRGLNVTVNVLGPDGKLLVEVNNTFGEYATEVVLLLNEKAGDYQLQVRPTFKDALPGRYTLKLEELRAAEPRDSLRIAAEKRYLQICREGSDLLDQGTIDSYRKAIEKFEEALAVIKPSDEPAHEAAILDQIGATYILLSEHKKAISYHERAIEIIRKLSHPEYETELLLSIGVAYQSSGDLQKAFDYFNQAIVVAQRAGFRHGELNSLNNIGLLSNWRGEHNEAISYYNRTLSVLKSLGDRENEGVVLGNIAMEYDSMGEKQKALDYYNQALQIQQAIGDRLGFALSNYSIGVVYTTINEYKKALVHYELALQIIRELNIQRYLATVLSGMGSVYYRMGDLKKALGYLNQALPILKDYGFRIMQGRALILMGKIHHSSAEYLKALEYYNQAIAISQTLGTRELESRALSNIGDAYYSLGDKQKSLDSYSRALEISHSNQDRMAEANLLQSIARIKRDTGNLLEARKDVEKALEIVELVRTKFRNPELRVSYFASVQQYYGFYIDLLMQLHQQDANQRLDAAALEASERARARTLLEMLIEGRADIRKGVDPALLERERSLQRNLDAGAERQARLLSGKHTEQQAADMKKEIDQLLTRYQEVQSQIRASSPRYAALTQPQPLSLKQIQKEVLDSDTLLLEYALGDEHSYLWAVTSDSIASFRLPERETVEKAARQVYELLTVRNRREQGMSSVQRQARIKQSEAEYNRAAAELSQMILGPVAAHLGKKRLLVVADGILNYVPFAALPAPAAQDRQRLLIADHEIISLPSASSIAVLRKEMAGRKPAPKAAAVLADPVFDADDARVQSSRQRGGKVEGSSSSTSKKVSELALIRSANEVGLTDRGDLSRLPFSRQEAAAIYALTRQAEVDRVGTRVALDFEASRETASSPDLGQYRIVHFATHGLLNNEHPELSGIVLSLVDKQGKPQNGFFRLYDVYNMNLTAELVVLSACQTALGKQVRGEGLIGLTRGFMYAGSARVMASLWRVEDEATAEMMKKFYEGMIKDGQRPAAALRSAQVWMQGQKRWRAPYYWAGFTLQGEWK